MSTQEEGLRRPGPAVRIRGSVEDTRRLGGNILLTVAAAEWPGARPGQFAMLQADPSGCFLPRALSVAGQGAGWVSFLIAPVGEGTRELARLVPGDPLWVTGPLGNGFDGAALAAPPPSRIVIVAGGLGIAPFTLLVDDLAERIPGAGLEVEVLAGFRDAPQSGGIESLEEAAARVRAGGGRCRVQVTSEDGSMGRRGLVTDLLLEVVRPDDRVVVCGPEVMSRQVWRYCREKGALAVWFSLDTFMACGVGSCHGCVVTLADGSTARVCHEGPVFYGPEIFPEVDR